MIRLLRFLVVAVHILAAGAFGQSQPQKPAVAEQKTEQKPKAPDSKPAAVTPTPAPAAASNPTGLSTGQTFIQVEKDDEIMFLRFERQLQEYSTAIQRATADKLDAEKKQIEIENQFRKAASDVAIKMKIDVERFDFDALTNHFVEKKKSTTATQ